TSLVRVPGYSWAITLATDQASNEWPEGNESPPSQNFPLPSPVKGGSRPATSFDMVPTKRLFASASPLKKPVSRMWLSWLWVPQRKNIPAAPANEETPTLEISRLRSM